MRNFAFCVKLIIGIGMGLCSVSGCTTKRTPAVSPGNKSLATSPATELRIRLTDFPSAFDPAKVEYSDTIELMMNAFESLLRYDQNSKLEPCLALRWTLDPTGTRYTFHLRPDVKLHDGRPLTAAMVKASWERSLLALKPYQAVYFEPIVGAKEVIEGTQRDLKGVRVTDALTLTVTLNKPCPYFVNLMAFAPFAIAVPARDSPESLVGTGAFALETFTNERDIVLKRFDDYWGGKPLLSRLRWKFLKSNDAASNAYAAGELDIVPDLPAANVQGATTGDVHHFQGNGIPFLVLNADKVPAFQKQAVREAIAAAIDWDEIRRVSLHGAAKAATLVSPDILLPLKTYDFPYDPAKARRLLAQAGYPDGKNFPPIYFSLHGSNADENNLTEQFRTFLQAVGIDVPPVPKDNATQDEDMKKGMDPLLVVPWELDYPDPRNLLTDVFHSKSKLIETGYRDKEFDRLCDLADTEQNPAKRTALFAQAQDKLLAETRVIPIRRSERIVRIRSQIVGWSHDHSLFLPHIKTAINP